MGAKTNFSLHDVWSFRPPDDAEAPVDYFLPYCLMGVTFFIILLIAFSIYNLSKDIFPW